MINLDSAGDALKYLKMPRPGESRDKYIGRVGINAAKEVYGKKLTSWVGGKVYNATGSHLAGGAAAGGTLGALGALASGGDVKRAAIGGAASGAANAAITGNLGKSWGAAGGAAGSLASSLATGSEVDSMGVAQGAALSTMTAGLGTAASIGAGAVIGVPTLVGAFQKARSAKTAHARLTLDDNGKMITTGPRAGTNVQGALRENKEGVKRAGDYLRRTRDKRWQEFQDYTAGYSEEERKNLLSILGSDYFTPSIHLSATGLRGLGETEDVDKYFANADDGHGILAGANPEDLGRASALANVGYQGSMADFSGRSSGGNAEQGNEWSRVTYDDALRTSRREQEIQGKIDALDPSDSWGRKSLERARIANDPSKAVQDKQEQIFTQAQQYGQHMYDREN